MRSSVTLVTAAAAALTAATPYQCPPLGPVLPKAKNPSTHPAVQAAVSAFIAGLEAETATFTGSAVSIGVKSSIEEGPLVDFHFTPPERDPRGASAVDTHTVYRLASVTKIFPVLAALQNSDLIGWEDSVAKFIPELRDAPKGELDYVDWEDVTVEAAAVHIGGVAAESKTHAPRYLSRREEG